MELHIRRLKQGKSLFEIFKFLLEAHPKGLKRSEIQKRLRTELNVGESIGGVNRHLRKLRDSALIEWDQETYTYKLGKDLDCKGYFIRAANTFDLSTDNAYFLSLKMKNIISSETIVEIDDYIGHRYDEEMNENIEKLENQYKVNEIHVHEDIKRLLKHHNSYVRLRLFRTTNECFINDIGHLEKNMETDRLLRSYLKNIDTINDTIKTESNEIFKIREKLINHLREKRLSRRMKFLIRFSLNHIRPSHVYDGMI